MAASAPFLVAALLRARGLERRIPLVTSTSPGGALRLAREYARHFHNEKLPLSRGVRLFVLVVYKGQALHTLDLAGKEVQNAPSPRASLARGRTSVRARAVSARR